MPPDLLAGSLGDKSHVCVTIGRNNMSPALTITISMLTTHLYPVQDGSTALHAAAQEGHLRVVEMLLEANADVNIKKNVRVIDHLYTCCTQ